MPKKRQRKHKKRKVYLNLIDAWSVPHFLFGGVTALFAVGLELPFWPMLGSTLLAAILWEFFEMKVKIREQRWNVVSDIAMPLISFLATFFLFSGSGIDQEHLMALFTATLLVFLFTSTLAWSSRLYRDRDFLG